MGLNSDWLNIYSDYTLKELRELCDFPNTDEYKNLTREDLVLAILLGDVKEYSFGKLRKYCDGLGLETKGLTKNGLLALYKKFLTDEDDYLDYTLKALLKMCQERGILGYKKLNKEEIKTLLLEDDEILEDGEPSTKKEYKEPSHKEKKHSKVQKDVNIPTIKLTDIAGLDEAKKALEERVILPLTHKEIYDKYGKSVGGGILLFGLPGTGKTMFAQAVATELNAKFFSIKCSDIQSKWYGEAEKNVKNLFAEARKHKRAVIFFDEFDALGSRRKENNDGVNTVQEILAQMQGVEKNNNLLLVIAATNCPWTLDGALLRPGRFNEKLYIPLPDKNARVFVLNKELKNCKLETSINIEDIAEQLDGCNGADIVEFCEKVKMLLIRKEIAKDEQLIITQNDISEILATTKSSVQQRDVDSMNAFLQQK